MVSNEFKLQKSSYKCGKCDYVAGSKFNLKRHHQVHDGQRLVGVIRDPKDETYQCSSCDKRFIELGFLASHIKKSHMSNQRFFNCMRCMRSFANKLNKDRHEIRCDNRSYECYICRKYVTINVANMRKHIKTHNILF